LHKWTGFNLSVCAVFYRVLKNRIFGGHYSTQAEDGSIGTLYVARTGKTIKVYEGEDLSNLKIGAGHFSSASAWDGLALRTFPKCVSAFRLKRLNKREIS
jgi:hypothetical protein